MEDILTDRKKKILKAIIKTYMETGEPVGSRTISKYTDLNVSSATIRNEMSDLTDLGYIVQPHTSAGRIPSDKGYRLYVDELMQEKEDEIEELTLEIANTRSVSPQTKEEVLEEFYQVCLAQQYIAEGGIGYAKELLEKALGNDKAQGVIAKLQHLSRFVRSNLSERQIRHSC